MDALDQQQVREQNGRPAQRRPYTAPRLTTYGSLRALTREVSCNVNKDGGSNAICRRT